MRRLLVLAVRLYPAAWRRRYGTEFMALLDEQQPRWGDIGDVALGGFEMRFRYSGVVMSAAVLGVASAAVAGAMALRQPDRFEARGVMMVSPAATADGASAAPVADAVLSALNAETLLPTADRHGLYRQEATDVRVERFRRDISVQLAQSNALDVVYTAADGRQAQQVAADLMNQIAAAAGRGIRLRVLDLPQQPTEPANRFRVVTASLAGLGGGLIVGSAVGMLRRRRSSGS